MLLAKDYIAKAAGYLGLCAFSGDIKNNEINEENDGRLGLFFDALNHIVCETAYFCPCVHSQKITVEGGRFPLESLDGGLRIIEIISLKKDGKNAPFRVGFSSIELTGGGFEDGEYTLEAAVYLPASSLFDNVIINACVPENVLIYGICALYCMSNGLSDAAVWDRKYRLSQNSLSKKTRERRVGRRTWA